MVQGRWKPTDEYIAQEAYAVLIRHEPASRVRTKLILRQSLSRPEIYVDFLKLCLEHEKSKELKAFRKGLLLVVQAVGVSQVAERSGLSRISIYRMLSLRGNPRLSSLMELFSTLNLRFWIVDEEFVRNTKPFIRPKDQAGAELPEWIARASKRMV